jgi:hypothetical protein
MMRMMLRMVLRPVRYDLLHKGLVYSVIKVQVALLALSYLLAALQMSTLRIGFLYM